MCKTTKFNTLPNLLFYYLTSGKNEVQCLKIEHDASVVRNNRPGSVVGWKTMSIYGINKHNWVTEMTRLFLTLAFIYVWWDRSQEQAQFEAWVRLVCRLWFAPLDTPASFRDPTWGRLHRFQMEEKHSNPSHIRSAHDRGEEECAQFNIRELKSAVKIVPNGFHRQIKLSVI